MKLWSVWSRMMLSGSGRTALLEKTPALTPEKVTSATPARAFVATTTVESLAARVTVATPAGAE